MEPSPGAKRVLVVDDEPMVREVVCAYLEREGFRAREAADGEAAMSEIGRQPPDLVVLDVMLPEIDGMSVLSEIRKTSTVPVILLTARSDEADRILGLEAGADDYVVKPFSPRELVARVRSVLRRSGGPIPPRRRLVFDDLVIDGITREVQVADRVVDMPPREFDLLSFLAASPRRVFSRGELLERVWGSSPDWQDPSTVTVHVRRLRQKIEHDPDRPRRITTVWGVGYRFEP